MVQVLNHGYDGSAPEVSGASEVACEVVASVFAGTVALVVASLIALMAVGIPVAVYWVWSDSRRKMAVVMSNRVARTRRFR